MKATSTKRRMNEGGHGGDCKCGFCERMRKNKGGGGDTDSKKSDDKDEKKPTAESIVRNLLDT